MRLSHILLGGALLFSNPAIADDLENCLRQINIEATKACSSIIDHNRLPAKKMAEVLFARGLDYHASGRHVLAIDDYKKSYELDHSYNNVGAYINIGVSLIHLKRYSDADHFISNALKMSLSDHGIYVVNNAKGDILYNTHREKEAIPFYTKAIVSSPESLHPHFFRGLAFAVTGDIARAEADINTAKRLRAEQGKSATLPKD